jgi:hypothetical protein
MTAVDLQTNKEHMNSLKKTARIVGVFYIISTVAGILCNLVILEPILNAPDYLTNVSGHENQVIIAALFDLLCAGVFVVVAVVIFPILKKLNETIAVGYVVARIFEAVPFVIGVISYLSLVRLSQEFVQAGAPDAAYFHTAGTLLLTVRGWTELLGPTIFFGLTALILNQILYQSKLVPRWLSGWGLLGAILIVAGGLGEPFGFSQRMLLAIPIALQEMVFAVWLIVKGFNVSALAAGSATTDHA